MLAKPRDFYYEDDKANPHSVIITWASNAYSRINYLMRNHSLNTIYKDTPSAFRYIQHVLAYFDSHGVSPKTLLDKQITTLYRGIDARFRVREPYDERGFISTSWKKIVAERFADMKSHDNKGLLQCYRVNKLSSNAKYVIIDSTVAPHLRESEILFMPGFIEFDTNTLHKGACVQCKYTPNEKIINAIRKAPMPKQKKMVGGAEEIDIEKTIREAMGKRLVYYRVRYQQPVEIFDQLDIPNNWDDAVDVIRFTRVKMEQGFENINEYIPEFTTLRDKIRNGAEVTKEMFHTMNGFQMWPALYDPHTQTVITTHFFLPEDLYYDMFDRKRVRDVVKAIQNVAT